MATLFFNDFETAGKIQLQKNPKEAKKLGRLIKGYDDEKWATERFNRMVHVNILKYSQSEFHKENLFRTKDRILVEASPYDKIWGVGLKQEDDLILDERNWLGHNLLGRVLMKVRENLISVQKYQLPFN